MRAALVGFWEALFVDRNLFTAATGEREREKKRDMLYLNMNGRRKGSSWVMEGGRDWGFY